MAHQGALRFYTKANGGRISIDAAGKRFFVLDGDVHGRLRRKFANIPQVVPVDPAWRNRTPPFAPTLGGHIDPSTGEYCHPEAVLSDWNLEWQFGRATSSGRSR